MEDFDIIRAKDEEDSSQEMKRLIITDEEAHE
jgi:hypothetical protein